MIDPTVRRAELADIEQLQALESVARSGAIEMRGGPRWLETHPPIAWPVRITGGEVLVAHIDLLVVGCLVFSIRERLAAIELVYVAAEARELGFGDTMVEHVFDLARAASAIAIEAEALPGDRDTKNLFERAGVTARLIVLARSL